MRQTTARSIELLAVLAVAASTTGCGADAEAERVASKRECIPEVAKRLVACSEEKTCEEGVSRYAGYCYNTAEGSQLDICRGGQYFFERPLQELTEADPNLIAQLNDRQERILVMTGEAYCVYNHN
jgi:hypothetical protein